MGGRLIVGDVREVLPTLPDASVDLVMSSPPFLALRSYLPADHPDKGLEIGSEATPADFLDTLLDVVEGCRRVLTPHGSLVFELGDTYSGSGGSGGDYGWDRLGQRGAQEDQPPNFRRKGQVFEGSKKQGRQGNAWPLDKSLTGIPTLFAWSLAYGRNLLRPERTTDPWRIRNLVAWCRPNPPVGALGDKFRPGTSYLTVATMARDRWFDMDAVRVPGSENTHARTATGVERRTSTGKTADDDRRNGNFSTLDTLHDTNGAPLLDWWSIPTQPYKGSHYATYPEELPRRVILSMCPERVCRTCGEPSRRLVETTNSIGAASRRSRFSAQVHSKGDALLSSTDFPDRAERVTTGWTECDCSDDRNPSMGHLGKWRPGVVLDPFAGSGTTGQVATRLGRDAILIDLDESNVALMQARIGLFFERTEAS